MGVFILGLMITKIEPVVEKCIFAVELCVCAKPGNRNPEHTSIAGFF